ncbi:MAG: hypothetical protein Q7T56_10165 [Nocardioidaceae bacterium]|nr:hypothetical protein [Nocardioidaceae bacterium]
MTSTRSTRTLLLVAVVLAAAVALAGTSTVSADTAPDDPNNPGTPVTVSADALPTVQVNGVVWQQVTVGDTVYATGSFTSARPAGAAAGVDEVPRSNALAYDIRTGTLLPWAPALNAQGLAVVASPDGRRIYLGGDFTQVNGATRSRLVAVDPTNGATIGAFSSRTDAKVKALAATTDTVYVGGLMSTVGGVSRFRVGALRASDGAVLPFRPVLEGGAVNAIVVAPDRSKVVLGGAFTKVNGSSRPGYGLMAVDASTGASLPWSVNDVVRNGGSNAAVTSLSADADGVYGTGYVYGSGGNFEGTFRARWSDGRILWLEDCHGDSYGAFPRGDDVYVVSHAHYCANIGAYPEGPARRATAFSKAATSVVRPNGQGGYASFAGQPAPSLLQFFPDVLNGTYTGQGQGAWSVTGNTDFVAIGGEFPRVNGTAQQGLTRFAAPSIAPNDRGGVLTGSKLNPALQATGFGRVVVTWPANWDQDNRRLTYRVIRDGNTTTPVHTTAQDSTFWSLPSMSFTDSGLVPDRSYRYRVFSSDAFGNETRSDTVTITAR